MRWNTLPQKSNYEFLNYTFKKIKKGFKVFNAFENLMRPNNLNKLKINVLEVFERFMYFIIDLIIYNHILL